MAIEALPTGTTRLLGSFQVLTTSASLVKELIDNALDARADSVEVIVSSNTLDRIEVRDNGHGIDPQDLHCLGRRGHTSKLKAFKDVLYIGPASLGFRGEALASATQLGDVLITTRIEGETIAMAVRLQPSGGIASRSSISHPVGTSVCVSNFLSKIAVRRQLAVREGPKNLTRIKEIIQSYSMARLNVRFSLSVIKPGKEKDKWIYAPRPSITLKDTISQIVGRETAALCVETSFTAHHSPPDLVRDRGYYSNSCEDCETISFMSGSGHRLCYKFRAFLPRPDENFTKISHPQYLSVDSRPISSSRGIGRKMICILKRFLGINACSSDLKEVKDPFLWLNIICPPGSYDVNIEPAKDTVLFENEEFILRSVEDMFEKFYRKSTCPGAISEGQPQIQSSLSDHEYGKRDSYDNPDSCQGGPENQLGHAGYKAATDIAAASAAPNSHTRYDLDVSLDHKVFKKWEFDMSRDYTEYLTNDEVEKHAEPRQGEFVECDILRNSNTPLNPWVIAKLITNISKSNSHEAMTSSKGIARTESIQTGLPTPRGSSEDFHSVLTTQADEAQTSDEECSSRGAVNADIMWSGENIRSINRLQPLKSNQSRMNESKRSSVRIAAMPPLYPQSILKSLVSSSLGREESNGKLGRTIDGCFNPSGHAAFDNPEVIDAMDFERRKDLATKNLREKLRVKSSPKDISFRSSFTPVAATSVHDQEGCQDLPSVDRQPRIRKGSEIDHGRAVIRNSLISGDCQDSLTRNQDIFFVSPQALEQTVKLKIDRTLPLPLESVPEVDKLHDLCLKLLTSVPGIRRQLSLILDYSDYARCGAQIRALERPDLQLDDRVMSLVESWRADADEASVLQTCAFKPEERKRTSLNKKD